MKIEIKWSVTRKEENEKKKIKLRIPLICMHMIHLLVKVESYETDT